jgi:hypothetical protein
VFAECAKEVAQFARGVFLVLAMTRGARRLSGGGLKTDKLATKNTKDTKVFKVLKSLPITSRFFFEVCSEETAECDLGFGGGLRAGDRKRVWADGGDCAGGRGAADVVCGCGYGASGGSVDAGGGVFGAVF